ncbi:MULTISPECIES: FkbM family methyltransferase [unclassified Streptomyces]|uniref:Methyltransferase FkbM family n=1 Tax=Streptomyces sp. F12 TaxID=1436084 RepID=V9Z4N8_9ACTN|nr:FkbM family methyltransferase [Streptomyces sp. F12]AHE40430.1 Methyltransferase FkbM family [Streptomyces sp. F12]
MARRRAAGRRAAGGALVGAHTRYFTVLASRLVEPAGRVIAIEPSPAFHRTLGANLAANGCGNVRTINAAVSDATGRMTFYLKRSTNLGGSTAVLPRTVEASIDADWAPLPQLLTEA